MPATRLSLPQYFGKQKYGNSALYVPENEFVASQRQRASLTPRRRSCQSHTLQSKKQHCYKFSVIQLCIQSSLSPMLSNLRRGRQYCNRKESNKIRQHTIYCGEAHLLQRTELYLSVRKRSCRKHRPRQGHSPRNLLRV